MALVKCMLWEKRIPKHRMPDCKHHTSTLSIHCTSAPHSCCMCALASPLVCWINEAARSDLLQTSTVRFNSQHPPAMLHSLDGKGKECERKEWNREKENERKARKDWLGLVPSLTKK
eukprot:1160781-Pelagomonas_calceolata.AAC.7